jgi:hypothetical protein
MTGQPATSIPYWSWGMNVFENLTNERPTSSLDSLLARDEFIPDNLTNQGAEPGISRQGNLK